MRTLFLVFALMLGSAQTRTCSAQSVYVQDILPPQEWRQYYYQMEKCTGLKGDFSKIRWQVTPKPWSDHTSADVGMDSSMTFGMWMHVVGAGDSTKIILNATDAHIESYIKHEELHDILWRNGWEGPDAIAGAPDSVNVMLQHPNPPFGVCAPIYMSDMRKLEAQKQVPWKEVYQP